MTLGWHQPCGDGLGRFSPMAFTGNWMHVGAVSVVSPVPHLKVGDSGLGPWGYHSYKKKV